MKVIKTMLVLGLVFFLFACGETTEENGDDHQEDINDIDDNDESNDSDDEDNKDDLDDTDDSDNGDELDDEDDLDDGDDDNDTDNGDEQDDDTDEALNTLAAFYEGEGAFPIYGTIFAFHAYGYYLHDGKHNAIIIDIDHDYDYGDYVKIDGRFNYFRSSGYDGIIDTFVASKTTLIETGREVNVPIENISFEDFLNLDFENPYVRNKVYQLLARNYNPIFDARLKDVESFEYIDFSHYLSDEATDFLKNQHGMHVEIAVIPHEILYPDNKVRVGFDPLFMEPTLSEPPIYTSTEDFLHQTYFYEEGITFEGIVIGGFDNKFYVFDGKQALMMDRSYYFTTDIEIGDLVQFSGKRAYWFYAPVLQYSSYEIIKNDQTFDLSYQTSSIETLYETIDPEDYFAFNQLYSLKGRLVESIYSGRYYLKSLDSDAHVVLDRSYMSSEAFDQLTPYLDKTIEIDLLLATYTYEHVAEVGDEFVMAFIGDKDNIGLLALSDQETVEKDVSEIILSPRVLYKMDLNLPTSGTLGTSFLNWQSSHPDLIDHDGTYLSLPSEDTIVTFTMQAQYQSYQHAYSFEVMLKASPSSVKEALEADLDEELVVEGLIFTLDYYEYGIMIQDEAGYGIFVEVSAAEYNSFENIKKIIVHGTRHINDEGRNQEPRLTDVTIIERIDVTDDTIYTVKDQSINDILEKDQPYAKRYLLTDVEIDVRDFNHNVIFIQADGHAHYTRLVLWATQMDDFDYQTGTTFKWVELTISRYYNGYLYVSGVTYELSDEE